MKMKLLRINRDIAASSVVTFMSHDRELVEEAYAGDIIGIPNHGNIQIGDSFSRGRAAGVYRHSVFRAGIVPQRAH